MNELDVFCQDPTESFNKVRNQHKCIITNAPVLFFFEQLHTDRDDGNTETEPLVGLFGRKRGMCQMYTFFFPSNLLVWAMSALSPNPSLIFPKG